MTKRREIKFFFLCLFLLLKAQIIIIKVFGIILIMHRINTARRIINTRDLVHLHVVGQHL